MKLDPSIHIVMHSILSLKSGVTSEHRSAVYPVSVLEKYRKLGIFLNQNLLVLNAKGIHATKAHQNHLTDFFNNKKAQLYSNPLAILVQVPTLPTKPQQIHSLHHQSHRFFPFKV